MEFMKNFIEHDFRLLYCTFIENSLFLFEQQLMNLCRLRGDVVQNRFRHGDGKMGRKSRLIKYLIWISLIYFFQAMFCTCL